MPSPVSSSSSISRKRKSDVSTDDPSNSKKRKNDTVDNLPPHSSKGGLTHSIPGTTYQQKIMLLALLTGVSNENQHNLCIATEMKEAEKFDDFIYAKENSNASDDVYKNVTYDFYQMKHVDDLNETITLGQLNSVSESSKFNLFKYFLSYRMMLHTFKRYTIGEFIICTTISIDTEPKAKNTVAVKATTPNPDPFFNYDGFSRSMLNDKTQLKTLPKATYFGILAYILINHFGGSKKMPLTFDDVILILYHTQLFEKKILIRKGTNAVFNVDFLLNKIADQNLKNFYVVLNDMCISRGKKISNLINIEVPCPASFGVPFVKCTEKLDIRSCEEFAGQISDLLNSSQEGNNEVLNIEITKNVSNDFLKKLAGRVLFYSADKCEIVKDKNKFKTVNYKIKFGLSFLNLDVENNDVKILQQEFQKKIKEEEMKKLKNYEIRFPIENYETCFEDIHPFNEFISENDETIQNEIDQFLKKLVFLKTPKEKELDVVLEQKMRERLNLNDPEFEQSFMEKQTLNWMKEKQGSYFTSNDTENLFIKIEQSLGIKGYRRSTSRYCRQLKHDPPLFKIKESKLKTFLSSKAKGIFYVYTNCFLLASIKVYEMSREKYKNHDSYIFDDAVSLQNEIDELKNACESKKALQLLIIVCEKNLIANMMEQLKGIEKSKKIMFITDKQLEDLGNVETMDDNQLKNLTTKNRKKLLKKTVQFQGESLELGTVVNNELISNQMLVEIIQNKELMIGKKIEEFVGYDPAYYISRKLKRQIVFDVNILQETQNDLFVIEADDETLFTKEDTISSLIKEKKLIFQSSFRKDEISSEKNTHYLKQKTAESTDLVWQKSSKSIDLFINSKFRKMDHVLLEENQTLTSIIEEKSTIISNVAGMGKSTTLTHLALLLKEENPTYWIIKINLITYIDLFDNSILLGQDIFEELIKEEVNVGYRNLFDHFLSENKIIFMLDGYDEVNQKGSNIDKLLKHIKISNAIICITTRTQYENELEKSLKTFSHVFEPFEKFDQFTFLKKFWSNQWKKKSGRQHLENKVKLLKKYVKEIIKRFCTLDNNEIGSLIGIPLQLKMIAEIFQKNSDEDEWQGCFNYLDQEKNMKPILPAVLKLFEFYEMFVSKKIEILLKDKHKVHSSYVFDICKQKELEDHTIMSLKLLLNKNNNLLQDRNIKKALTNLGFADDAKNELVQSNSERISNFIKEKGAIGIAILTPTLSFIHLTYAEYFAAIFLFDEIEFAPESAFQCIEEIMAISSLVFPNCINYLINKTPEKVKSCFNGLTLLNFAAKNNYFNIVKRLLPYNNNRLLQDKLNRTPLHYASEYGHNKIVAHLLVYYNACSDLSYVVYQINLKDEYGKNAIYYAKSKKHNEIFELLSKIIEISRTHDLERNIEIFEAIDFSPMRYAESLTELIEIFFEYLENINEMANPLKILSECIENDATWMYVFLNTSGFCNFMNFLFLDGKHSAKDISTTLKVILPEERKKGSCLNALIKKVIHYTSDNEHWFAIDRFLKENRRESFENYLIRACKSHNENVINHLMLHYQRKLNNPVLVILKFAKSDETIKPFITKENIDVQDESGNTPIIIALKRKASLDLIKFLLEKEPMLILKTNKGENVLSIAIRKKRTRKELFEILNLLIEREPNLVHISNNDGETPLFYAVRTAIKFRFMENQERQKFQNRDSTLADVVRFLIENGADVNHMNTNGETPMDFLPKNNYVSEYGKPNNRFPLETRRIKNLLDGVVAENDNEKESKSESDSDNCEYSSSLPSTMSHLSVFSDSHSSESEDDAAL